MENDTILILDFGGQYSQLIARRVRECSVYSMIVPFDISIEEIKSINPKGIIFSGGPSSVYEKDAPFCTKEIFDLEIPILGICYGMQLISKMLGGEVEKAEKREYGITDVKIEINSNIFFNMSTSNQFLMSHTDVVKKVANGFRIIASTASCNISGIENKDKKIYGLQFHPEVSSSKKGNTILKNYLFNVCNCKNNWKMSSFIEKSVNELKEKIGDKKVLCALSGGVDSSVTAVLLNKAIGKNLVCIFVDHGLLRKNEADEVEKFFKNEMNMNFIRVNAEDVFLKKLAKVTEPELKRKIIGEEFIRTFENEAKKLGKIDYLAQGTIYPDVIESGKGKSDVIKSHHNVGGLPTNIEFDEIIEPLRNLFKDEVRKLGLELGLSKEIVYRQPFPGPGLAIRIIGEVTKEKLDLLRNADAIFREEIEKENLNENIGQYFAVLTNTKSVGVMGDERTYDYTIALRAVDTTDYMTGRWTILPYGVLEKASSRIVNEVKGVNRVVYDITSKPPATIEWE